MNNIFTKEFLEEIEYTEIDTSKDKLNESGRYKRAWDKDNNIMIVWSEEEFPVTEDQVKAGNTPLGIALDKGRRLAYSGVVYTQDEVRMLLKLVI